MSILCGTDLSATSADALVVAVALAAQRHEREVIAVHVVDREAEAPAAKRALDAFISEHAPRGDVAVRGELLVGASDDVLVAYAEVENSDLIVIAAQSRPGDSLLRLGSTAERIVVATRTPVLVVRDPAPWLAYARGDAPLRALIAIDDSIASELGQQWLHAERRRGAVEVVLGSIYYPDEAAARYGLHAASIVDRDPEAERLLVRDLSKQFGATERVTARARRGLGRIGDHVIELAREEAVHAIVVGTGQKTGLGRLGSVSTVVLHDAPQSIVCVPPNANVPTLVLPPLTATLAATDLSPFANRAVPYALSLTATGGTLHLVHVVEEDGDTALDDRELSRQLSALAPAGSGREVIAHIVRGPDAATAIAQAAARFGADAICIASHGRSGLSRALVGSVADRLLRVTRKPVLVLRPG